MPALTNVRKTHSAWIRQAQGIDLERIYILAKVDANTLETILNRLQSQEGIKTVDAVTGPYDLLISLEGESVARMLSTVVKNIRNIPGIISTETLVVINLD